MNIDNCVSNKDKCKSIPIKKPHIAFLFKKYDAFNSKQCLMEVSIFVLFSSKRNFNGIRCGVPHTTELSI